MDSQGSIASVVSETGRDWLDLILPAPTDYDDSDLEQIEETVKTYFDYPDSDEGSEEEVEDYTRPSPDEAADSGAESEDDHEDSFLDLSADDVQETVTQEHFFERTCGCSKIYGPGQPCSQMISLNAAVQYREYCRGLEKDVLETAVKMQLLAHRRSGSSTEGKHHMAKERERPYQIYYFQSKQICRETFAFLHGYHVQTLKAVGKSLDVDGLDPRVHGNTRRLPKHTLSLVDSLRIRAFIVGYADQHGMPLPGRMPNYRDFTVTLLPSDTTKATVHQLYIQAAEDQGFCCVSYSKFSKLWAEVCPHINVMKPSSDLCPLCQKNMTRLSRASNLTEEEKSQKLEEFQQHLDKAKLQRTNYKDQCTLSTATYAALPPRLRQSGQAEQSNAITMHYSFDYLQQIHYPTDAQQASPVYFLTRRKCTIFIVSCEPSGRSVFYLIDEADNYGKGANATCSLFHHYLQQHGLGEQHLALHFDNCVGQNLNNTVMQYLMWRCMTGRHSSILVSTMLAGHTKFWCDLAGGTFKRKWRKSKAASMEQIAELVQQSTPGGHNVPQLVPEDVVLFYEWNKFISPLCHKIPNITRYHHFRFSADEPGVVYLREVCDAEESPFQILQQPAFRFADVEEMPQPTVNQGIALDRQWYLYEKVRPFCPEETADQVCPQPSDPKPSAADGHQPVPAGDSTAAKRAKQTCSHCKQPGHRRSYRGVVTCPQLTGATG